MSVNKISWIGISCLFLLFLNSCSSTLDNQTVTTGAAYGAESAISNSIIKDKALIDMLQVNGVGVVQIGDELRLVIPAAKLFNQNTSVLNNDACEILDAIALLLNKENKFNTKIAAYTDNIQSPDFGLALSRQQAQAVLKYLLKKNIDSRFLSTIGYGASQPIANNKTEAGRVLNRRVEIISKLITDNTVD